MVHGWQILPNRVKHAMTSRSLYRDRQTIADSRKEGCDPGNFNAGKQAGRVQALVRFDVRALGPAEGGQLMVQRMFS